jgi:hypothetical protein
MYMTVAPDELILQKLQKRGCRSVHYWGAAQEPILRALVNANRFRISCSIPERSSRGYKREAAIRPNRHHRIGGITLGHPQAFTYLPQRFQCTIANAALKLVRTAREGIHRFQRLGGWRPCWEMRDAPVRWSRQDRSANGRPRARWSDLRK